MIAAIVHSCVAHGDFHRVSSSSISRLTRSSTGDTGGVLSIFDRRATDDGIDFHCLFVCLLLARVSYSLDISAFKAFEVGVKYMYCGLAVQVRPISNCQERQELTNKIGSRGTCVWWKKG